MGPKDLEKVIEELKLLKEHKADGPPKVIKHIDQELLEAQYLIYDDANPPPLTDRP